jgi:hypothetical protein
MTDEKLTERLYDLIEQFDFKDLPEDDKLFVTGNFSIEEYNDLRSTLNDTRSLFNSYGEPGPIKEPRLKRIVLYPVELYKVAAMIVILIAAGLLIPKAKGPDIGAALVNAIRDTVVITKKDTVEIIKEKIVYVSQTPRTSKSVNILISKNEVNQIDCSRENCPDDWKQLSRINTRGNLSKDSALRVFTVSSD